MFFFKLVTAIALLLVTGSTEAFLVRPCSTKILTKQRTIPQMCICINCARVTDCLAYHFVETKHNQPHMNENPKFEPRDGSPTIHVNIRTLTNQHRQQQIDRMLNEHDGETEQARKIQNEQDGPLIGETTYDLSSSTTYEYDVVKCADFVEDLGCWFRNMPEEIRKANPEFIPS